MTIWVDITGFTHPASAQNGIARVIANLLEELSEDREIKYKKLFFNARADAFFVVKNINGLSFVLSNVGNLLVRIIERWPWLWLSWHNRPKFSDGDTIFCPGAFWMHYGYHEKIAALKKQYHIRYIPLVYDLIPWRCPQSNSEEFNKRYLYNIKGAIALGERIITISQNSARDVKNFADSVGLSCPPIHVVYLGDSISLDPIGVNKSVAEWAEEFSRDEYVLAVSPMRVNKNNRMLINGWNELLKKRGRGAMPKLVFINNEDSLRRLVGSVPNIEELDEKIIILKNVKESFLVELYKRSLFTVYPSVYEGWGLPIRESFIFGKCCVVFNMSSMAEAGEDLANYVERVDLLSLSKIIESLLDDRQELSGREWKIREKFKQREWREFAEDIVSIIGSN